jgi:hypothetical protein
MATAKWSAKDPQDVRDYWVDFSSLLGDATIASSTVAVAAAQHELVSPYTDLALDEDDNTDTMVRARFSGGVGASGTAATKYKVDYHITASDGQEFDLTKTLEVKERTA